MINKNTRKVRLSSLLELKRGNLAFSTSHGYSEVVNVTKDYVEIIIPGSSITQRYTADGLSYKDEVMRELFVSASEASRYFKAFDG